MFTTLQVPDVDDTIIATTGQKAAIRADHERLDRSSMRLLHSSALPTLQVPQGNDPTTTATDQLRSARAPGQRVHFLARLTQGVQALSTICIPNIEFPTTYTSTPTGESPSIRTPGDSHDHATMPLQGGSHHPIGGLPEEYAAIIATTGQVCPVRAPGDPANPG